MADPASASTESPAWRTLATVLIILHLFSLAIGVASNAGGQRSALGRTLKNIPVAPQYLQALFMDVAYDFELGGVDSANGAHRLTLVAADQQRDPDILPATLPDEDVSLRVRRQRYENLAYHIAELDRVFAESPDDQTRLPLVVAEGWIARLGLAHGSYALRYRRIDAPRWQEDVELFDAAGKAEKKKDDASAFQVNVVWSPRDGHYEGFRGQASNLTAKAMDGTGE